MAVGDRNIDLHLYNDVHTIDEVSSECLSYSKRLPDTDDNRVEQRDIMNGEHIHDIYSDSYMKIVVSTSVDI